MYHFDHLILQEIIEDALEEVVNKGSFPDWEALEALIFGVRVKSGLQGNLVPVQSGVCHPTGQSVRQDAVLKPSFVDYLTGCECD